MKMTWFSYVISLKAIVFIIIETCEKPILTILENYRKVNSNMNQMVFAFSIINYNFVQLYREIRQATRYITRNRTKGRAPNSNSSTKIMPLYKGDSNASNWSSLHR